MNWLKKLVNLFSSKKSQKAEEYIMSSEVVVNDDEASETSTPKMINVDLGKAKLGKEKEGLKNNQDDLIKKAVEQTTKVTSDIASNAEKATQQFSSEAVNIMNNAQKGVSELFGTIASMLGGSSARVSNEKKPEPVVVSTKPENPKFRKDSDLKLKDTNNLIKTFSGIVDMINDKDPKIAARGLVKLDDFMGKDLKNKKYLKYRPNTNESAKINNEVESLSQDHFQVDIQSRVEYVRVWVNNIQNHTPDTVRIDNKTKVRGSGSDRGTDESSDTSSQLSKRTKKSGGRFARKVIEAREEQKNNPATMGG